MSNTKVNKTILIVASVTTIVIVVSVVRTIIVNRKQRQNDDYADDDDDEATRRRPLGWEDGTNNTTTIDPTIRYEFEEAVRKMKSKTFVANLKLSNQDKLLLYGLYKQVVVGDAPTEIPVTNNGKWNIMEVTAKYNAWVKNRGMSIEAAAFHYITAIEHYESITADWERCDTDSDEDDTYDTKDPMGPGAVSRPIMNELENDKFDDDIDDTGCKTIESQFFRAASTNDIDTIRTLFAKNDNKTIDSNSSASVDVNYRDPMGQTALHIAADKGCLDIIQILVQEYNADVNAVDDDEISVLQTAVIAGHADICMWLLSNTNANPDHADADGDTPRTSADDNTELKELFTLFPPK